MRLKNTINQFLLKAERAHQQKYDYSKVEYRGVHTKIEIICPTHGSFHQTPIAHTRGQGCPFCMRTGQFSTTDDFIKKAVVIHNNKYDYSLVAYVNSHTKVQFVCPIHGVFEQQPHGHLQGWGCEKCSYEYKGALSALGTDAFIRKAKLMHADFYDYSKVKYKNNAQKVEIICPIHGSFQQTPGAHTNKGSGCPTCHNTGSYNETIFRRHPNLKQIPGKLYLIQMENENESFFKIGITKTNVRRRYGGRRHHTYHIDILCEVDCTIYQAFVAEQQIKTKLQDCSYKPAVKFCGYSTECFHLNSTQITDTINMMQGQQISQV